MKCVTVLVLPLMLSTAGVLGQMDVIHRWKTPEFWFPSESVRQAQIASGNYVPNTGVIIDVDVDSSGRVFLTHPRFDNGTSVTLSTVRDRRQRDNPLLQPYPSWDWHQKGNCNGLTSIFRTKIDRCNRLWALDSGKTDVFGSFTQSCPPKLMVFDLTTDKLMRRYNFPQNVVSNDALIINIEVETDEACRNTYAYIANVVTYKMVVYNLDSDRSWVVNSSAFYYDPNYENFNIDGSEFELQDGLFALALSPKFSQNDHRLYFHSLASNCESTVRTSVLKNPVTFANNPNAIENQVLKCFGTRKGQSAAEAMDSNGNLFSANLVNNAIDCWNWYSTFDQRQVVRSDSLLQFISGMKVIRGSRGEDLWAISSKFQKIMTTGINRNEYNFHVVAGNSEALAINSGCQEKWTWS